MLNAPWQTEERGEIESNEETEGARGTEVLHACPPAAGSHEESPQGKVGFHGAKTTSNQW